MADEDAPQPWRPWGIRDTPAARDYDALVEGVPHHLERSLWRWVMDRAAEGRIDLVYRTERILHVSLHGAHVAAESQVMFQTYWAASNDDDRLRIIDWLLHDVYRRGTLLLSEHREDLAEPLALAISSLSEMLTEAGSAWRVADGSSCGLVRRVNDTTQAQVDAASSPDTDAANKVGEAWNLCFRFEPDYDNAYRQAVLAVEAVVFPSMLPNDQRKTLGKVVSHLGDTLGHWTVGGLDATEIRSSEALLAMLKTLWHSQQRHAAPDGTVSDVSREEAETAVNLAVTIVQWFSAGLVKQG